MGSTPRLSTVNGYREVMRWPQGPLRFLAYVRPVDAPRMDRRPMASATPSSALLCAVGVMHHKQAHRLHMYELPGERFLAVENAIRRAQEVLRTYFGLE